MITIEVRKSASLHCKQLAATDEPTVGQLVRRDQDGNRIVTLCIGCITSMEGPSIYAISLDQPGVENLVHRLVREAVLMNIGNFDRIRSAAVEAARDAVRGMTPEERLKVVE